MSDRSDVRQHPTGTNSHAAAPKPSRKRTSSTLSNGPQESLDVCAPVPLHERPVISYAEAAALGISPERTLRRLVATGRVRKAVLRVGRRVRFVVQDLLDELRGAEE